MKICSPLQHRSSLLETIKFTQMWGFKKMHGKPIMVPVLLLLMVVAPCTYHKGAYPRMSSSHDPFLCTWPLPLPNDTPCFSWRHYCRIARLGVGRPRAPLGPGARVDQEGLAQGAWTTDGVFGLAAADGIFEPQVVLVNWAGGMAWAAIRAQIEGIWVWNWADAGFCKGNSCQISYNFIYLFFFFEENAIH